MFDILLDEPADLLNRVPPEDSFDAETLQDRNILGGMTLPRQRARR